MTQPMKKSATWPLLLAGAAALWLALAPTPARADETDTQQWTLLTIDTNFSKRWRGYFEIQPRFGDDIGHLERMIVRPAIGYRLNSKVSLWQGYGWVPQFEPVSGNEHRSYQQLLYEDTVGKTGIVSRTRLEERFIDGAGGTALRLRSMIRAVHPISADRHWALVGSDEVFWNLNDTNSGPVSGFDQNRLFVGVSRQVNPELRVETGYLMSHINVPRTSENRRLDVWLVQFALRL